MIFDFLPPTETLLLFLGSALALLLTPGPAVLYIITRSVDQGRPAGLASVIGVELGNLVHVLAAAAGLSAILLSSALAFDVVKYLGAAYLIYLGIRTLLTPIADVSAPVERKPLGKIFQQAVVVAVLNPKTALFFFAFLPQFIDPARGPVGTQILFLGALFVLLGTLTDGSYALAAGTAGAWLRGNPWFSRFQRYVAGTIYIGLGITAALASNTARQD
ncbi:MAG: LysE family translocator [Anaerolineae bacterium]|nr:LysE family translocator [Anaerolineae bacterium]